MQLVAEIYYPWRIVILLLNVYMRLIAVAETHISCLKARLVTIDFPSIIVVIRV
jgi:hypothetical protein